MSTKPRTVDNIGVDVSVTYAQNQSKLDAKFLEGYRKVPIQTEVSVTTPYTPSEIELLFGIQQRNAPWAIFFSPPNYSAYRKLLFSHQIIPSLGSLEKQQVENEKISLLDLVKERKKKKKKTVPGWREEEEEKEEEKERSTLKKLLEYIAKLDKELAFINSRRSQYHKG